MTAEASPTNTRDLARELLADVEQIEDNAMLYNAGRDSAYQAVAIQLRNTLLRGRRALIERVFEDPRFHPFRPSNAPQEVIDGIKAASGARIYDLLDVRGRLSLSTAPPGAKVFVEVLPNPTLTLRQWLRQWIIRPDVIVEDLIEQVADEEVAHTQESIGLVIRRTMGWTMGGSAEGRQIRHAVIVALGEYVALRCRELLAAKEEHTNP